MSIAPFAPPRRLRVIRVMGLALGLAGLAGLALSCQRADDVSRQAPAHAAAAPRPAPGAIAPTAPSTLEAPAAIEAVAPAPTPVPAPEAAAEAEAECCGGACGEAGKAGGCGECNGGAVAKAAVVKAVPADAEWTAIQIAGMSCGGCARRISTALLGVDGILKVDVDLATQVVKVATSHGVDGRAMAAPRIAALGYRVVGP